MNLNQDKDNSLDRHELYPSTIFNTLNNFYQESSNNTELNILSKTAF